MKYFALITMLVFTSTATAKTILGCEVTQASNGNYFYKVDPTCQFDRTDLGERGDDRVILEDEEEEEEEE